MISTKELRICNFIDADFNGEGKKKIVEIYQINESGCVLADEFINNPNLDNLQEHWDEYLYGIELTDEWLVKFGFEKIAISVSFEDQTAYSIKTKTSSLNFVIMYYNGLWRFGFNTIQSHCFSHFKYVHQLQNLYFLLTNEELRLK